MCVCMCVCGMDCSCVLQVRYLAWSTDGGLLASAGTDGIVGLWSTDGLVRATRACPERARMCFCAVTDAGTVAALCGGAQKRFGICGATVVEPRRPGAAGGCLRRLSCPRVGCAKCVARRFGRVWIFLTAVSSATRREQFSFKTDSSCLNVDWSPDGSMLLASTKVSGTIGSWQSWVTHPLQRDTLYVFDTRSKSVLKKISGEEEVCLCVCECVCVSVCL
jgi:WD40 repeat protein